MANLFSRIASAYQAARTTMVTGWRTPGIAIPLPTLPEGTAVSAEGALQVSTVFAGIKLIAETIAACDMRVMTIDKDGTRTILTDDPVAYLLNWAPSPFYTAQSFREALITSALLYDAGGAAEVVRDNSGRITGFNILTSRDLSGPFQDEAAGTYFWRYNDTVKGQVSLPLESVIRVPHLTVSGFNGMSIPTVGAKAISLAAVQDNLAINVLGNAALPSLVVTEAATAAPRKTSPEVAKADRDAFVEEMVKWTSGAKQGRPLFLPPNLDTKALSHNLKDSQLVEAQELSVQRIASILGIPLVLLALAVGSQGYGSNNSQAFRSWAITGLRPWARRIEQEFSRRCWPTGDKYVSMDVAHLMRGSDLEQSQVVTAMVGAGIWTRNEAREFQGRDHSDNPAADLLTVSGAVTLLDEESLTKPDPQPPPGQGGPPEQDGGGQPPPQGGGQPAPQEPGDTAQAMAALDARVAAMAAQHDQTLNAMAEAHAQSVASLKTEVEQLRRDAAMQGAVATLTARVDQALQAAQVQATAPRVTKVLRDNDGTIVGTESVPVEGK